MANHVGVFVTAVCVLAAAAVTTLGSIDPWVSREAFQAIACLIALGLIADVHGHEIARATNGSTAFIPYLTAAALAPIWFTVVAVALSVFVQGVFAKRAAIKTVFNVAQATLSLSAAILAFRALDFANTVLAVAVPNIALVTVFLLMNTATVSAVVAIAEKRGLLEVWYKNSRSTVTYDLLALPFVYVFAQLYLHWGAVGTFVLAVPLIGARQLYRINWTLERTNQELLQLMVAAIEARDPYTSGHSQRVSRNSKIIARSLGLGEREIDRIGRAALLHDVGKIHEVFAPLLRKTSRLTAEENALMQTHSTKSAELIENVSYLRDLVDVVRHHHENWDGSGYPSGLAGETIPSGSRIIMFADTIDAMTTDRPYRAALTQQDVTSELHRLRGKQFDPSICDALLGSPLYSALFAISKPATPVSTRIVRTRLRLARTPAAS